MEDKDEQRNEEKREVLERMDLLKTRYGDLVENPSTPPNPYQEMKELHDRIRRKEEIDLMRCVADWARRATEIMRSREGFPTSGD